MGVAGSKRLRPEVSRHPSASARGGPVAGSGAWAAASYLSGAIVRRPASYAVGKCFARRCHRRERPHLRAASQVPDVRARMSRCHCLACADLGSDSVTAHLPYVVQGWHFPILRCCLRRGLPATVRACDHRALGGAFIRRTPRSLKRATRCQPGEPCAFVCLRSRCSAPKTAEPTC
jgi:hypothetical protein